jgi:hypothetical protein
MTWAWFYQTISNSKFNPTTIWWWDVELSQGDDATMGGFIFKIAFRACQIFSEVKL